MKGGCLALLLLLLPALGGRAEETTLFPFVLPWDDATPGITDCSGWNRTIEPVRVGADGHFYAGQQRIRFFGVNLVGPGAFPRHEDADKVAARLAKFGVNVVRFHHMDSTWSPLIDYPKGDSRQLNAAMLDRLDYLIARLKAHGIYANLNLLVGRAFKHADGLPAEIESLDVKDQHVVGFFHAPVRDLQKEYARALLAHRNPHTGLTYAADPAVAFVEINNENGLIHAWLGGVVDKLPAVFLRDLQDQWNEWLRRRYETTAKLRHAWNVKAEPLGAEMLGPAWALEQHQGAQATAGSNHCVTVTKAGSEGWHVQYNQRGLKLDAGRTYTVSFRARADRPTTISVSVGEAHPEWQGLGLWTTAALTPEWRAFQFTFNAARADANARLNFSDLAKQTGAYWFTDISLRPGGVVGLADSERLEGRTLPVFSKARFGERTDVAQRDWLCFLWETENRYWQTLYRYLKDDLHVRGAVIGTIVGCSTPHLMAQLDAVDTHAYWQHPRFPGKAWDSESWIVDNRSMVNESGGTLPGLAMRRVAGKPHCVTEYNHPAPNTYSSEGFLLLAAYAAWQDWDAIYAYSYCHRRDEWDTRYFKNFFDIDQHPTKMATLPAAAALFRRGDLPPVRPQLAVAPDKDREVDLLRAAHPWQLVSAQPAPNLPTTGDFIWQRGFVTVNTPRSKALIGFSSGQRFDLGGVVIEPGQTMQAGWSAITATETQPGHWLITATGYTANTGMVWRNAEKNSVGRNWGRAPSLVEGIPARIGLPGAIKAWALDERGQHRAELPVRDGVLEIGPQYQTLWYEIVTR